MAKKKVEKTEDVLMVFVGVRFSALKGKRYYLWREVEGLGAKISDNECGQWDKVLQRGATPGAVYLMKGSRGEDKAVSSLIPQSGLWRGMLEDEDLVAQWQMSHKGASMAADGAGKAKRELKKRLDLARLEPIRIAYQNARHMGHHSEQAHILAEVIRAVTSRDPVN